MSPDGDCGRTPGSLLQPDSAFFPGPHGELLEELRQRPQAVSVRLLDSSTAAVSWAPSPEQHNGSVVSVVSTTCLRPSRSQRMESSYCREVGGGARTHVDTHTHTHSDRALTGEANANHGVDDITGKLQQ